MDDRRAARILDLVANTTVTTSTITDLSGFSSATVVKYLRDLERSGLLTRVSARRDTAGRPAVVNELTEEGRRELDHEQLIQFRRLNSTYGSIWGPRRSLSFWGAPLIGTTDLFSRRPIQASPFEVVLEERSILYSHPVAGPDQTLFPRLEPLISWGLSSGLYRFIIAGAALLHGSRVSWDELLRSAAVFHATNRLGYVAESVGLLLSRPRSLRPGRPERMIEVNAPVDDETLRVARKWRVTQPVSIRELQEGLATYGQKPGDS